MKALYLCNKKKDCNLSPMCSRGCNHTFDEKFRENGVLSQWSLIRSSTDGIIMREDAVVKNEK